MRYRLHPLLTKKQYIELMLALQARRERLYDSNLDATVVENAEKAMRKSWNECVGAKATGGA